MSDGAVQSGDGPVESKLRARQTSGAVRPFAEGCGRLVSERVLGDDQLIEQVGRQIQACGVDAR